jgi:glyoxylase-like metal-dependent hydrolase (beta-lactamase superfamily II)
MMPELNLGPAYAGYRVTNLSGLFKLSARNPGPMTGTGNWTYLLDGTVPALIDAGVGAAAHLDEVASLLGESVLARVIVTHAHSDHASGAPALSARWPAVELRKYPWPEQDAKCPARWQPLLDGQHVAAGDLTLEAVHTPGHSPDHLCLWHAESRTLFSGDLLVEGGTVVIPGSRGGSLAAYLQSLARVEAMAPAVAFPAHGGAIEDPLGLIARYRAHRAERELQILEALKGGAGTVTAITAKVYAHLTPALRPVAEETVRAHLAKLRDEGRIEWDR